MKSTHEPLQSPVFDLNEAIAVCQELVGETDFIRFSSELMAVQGLAEHLAQANELQILAHYKPPRFPRPGQEVVRTALLAGLAQPTPEQIDGIVETRPVDLQDSRIAHLIDQGIPILPVTVSLQDRILSPYPLEVVKSRTYVDNVIIKNLKFGPPQR